MSLQRELTKTVAPLESVRKMPTGEISVIVIAGVAAIAALRAGRDAAGPAR